MTAYIPTAKAGGFTLSFDKIQALRKVNTARRVRHIITHYGVFSVSEIAKIRQGRSGGCHTGRERQPKNYEKKRTLDP